MDEYKVDEVVKIYKYKNRDWLYHKYIVLEKSLSEVGKICGVSVGAIGYWMRKYNIPRRTLSESKMGEKNFMYGKRGKDSPNFGLTRTEEYKNKMRGENNPSKRPETRAKISASKIGRNNPMYGKTGKANPNWQDGKSSELYGEEFNTELREQIRKRDDYTCQECDMTQKECISKYNKVLSVHHIDYDKKNNKLENLISLCVSCHVKTNYGRVDWTEHFRKKKEIN